MEDETSKFNFLMKLGEIISEILSNPKNREKIKDFMVTGSKKLMTTLARRTAHTFILVGGGELGVEIARVIVVRRGRFEAVDERGQDPLPIENFSLSTGIQVSKGTFHDIKDFKTNYDQIANKIKEMKSAHIILEKCFVENHVWLAFYSKAKNGDIHFIPDLDDPNIINRIQMKKFLQEKVGIDKKYFVEGVEIKNRKDMQKVKKFLDKNGKSIIKPAITSSGHGFEIIDDFNNFENCFKSAKDKSRTKTNKCILEKFLCDINEFYLISVKNKEGKIVVSEPIQYSKEFLGDTRGPVRLKWSIYPHKSMTLSTTNKDILKMLTRKIHENLRIPFLGVEFFLKDGNIFINEVTWRPDDMGIITILAFNKDQFEIFIDSLTYKNVEIIPNEGKFICKPILRKTHYPNFPERGLEEDLSHGYAIRVYNKNFPSDEYRIAGYFIIDIENTPLDEHENFLRDWLKKAFSGDIEVEEEKNIGNFYYNFNLNPFLD